MSFAFIKVKFIAVSITYTKMNNQQFVTSTFLSNLKKINKDFPEYIIKHFKVVCKELSCSNSDTCVKITSSVKS